MKLRRERVKSLSIVKEGAVAGTLYRPVVWDDSIQLYRACVKINIAVHVSALSLLIVSMPKFIKYE